MRFTQRLNETRPAHSEIYSCLRRRFMVNQLVIFGAVILETLRRGWKACRLVPGEYGDGFRCVWCRPQARGPSQDSTLFRSTPTLLEPTWIACWHEVQWSKERREQRSLWYPVPCKAALWSWLTKLDSSSSSCELVLLFRTLPFHNINQRQVNGHRVAAPRTAYHAVWRSDTKYTLTMALNNGGRSTYANIRSLYHARTDRRVIQS